MELLIVLAVLAGVAGIGFASWKVHGYSIARYGYSPYNLHMALAAIVFVVCVYFGLFVPVMFDTLNTIVYYSALGCGGAFMYFRAIRSSNWWIALWGVLTLMVIAVVVVLGWILLKRK